MPFVESLRALARRGALAALVAAVVLPAAAGHATPSRLPAQLPHDGVAVGGGGFTDLNEDQMQAVIRAAYAKLAEYAVGSGKRLSFELGPIETFRQDRFEAIRYLDVVDMPEGRVIDVARRSHSRRLRLGDLKTVVVQAAYAPTWRTIDRAWASADWGRELGNLSIGEVLRRSGAKQKAQPHYQAVSAFTVTARLAGEARNYRAAFFWMAGSQKGQARFIVADNIVQGVDLASRDTSTPFVPASGPTHLRSRRSIKAPSIFDDGSGSATCVSEGIVLAGTGNASGTADHASGSHSSHAEFQIDCDCNSDCSASCDSFVFSGSCTDTGLVTSTCHKIASSQATNSDYSSAGDRVAPQCAAGFGCIENECFGCFCGLSVGVSVAGLNVSFADSTAPSWNGNLPYSGHSCPLCRYADTPPSTGGGGGSGGGGTSCNEGDLVTPEECVEDCGGMVDGDFCDV